MSDEQTAANAVILAARDQARQALEEVTSAASIGREQGHIVHQANLVSLLFECALPGYPGWQWAATLTQVGDDAPVTVVEVELLPGEGALVAPQWVPWSVRLAQYREAQAQHAAEEAAAAEAAASELSDEDDADEDLLDNDFSDFDDELDGVDLDEDEDDDAVADDADDSDDSDDADYSDDDDAEDEADASDTVELGNDSDDTDPDDTEE